MKCAGAGAPVPGVRMAWAPPTPRSQRQSDRLLACTASPTGLNPKHKKKKKHHKKTKKKKKKKKKKRGKSSSPLVFPEINAPPPPRSRFQLSQAGSLHLRGLCSSQKITQTDIGSGRSRDDPSITAAGTAFERSASNPPAAGARLPPGARGRPVRESSAASAGRLLRD